MAGRFIYLSDLMKTIKIVKTHSHFLTHGFLSVNMRPTGRSLEFSRVISTLFAIADFPSQFFGVSQR